MNPKISVIFPVASRVEYLKEAIDSVLGQSFTDFELLIIKDSVSSEVEQIIDSYLDDRIRIIKFSINMGISAARNAGLLAAKAPYIALMDSDDVSLPKRFEIQYAWMENHPELTVCGSNFIKIFNDAQSYHVGYPEVDGVIKSRLFIVDSAILNPTAMFRTEFVRKNYIRYDSNFPRDQDHRFYVEMMRSGAVFYNIQEYLLLYRRHEGNATNDRLKVDQEKTRIREILVPLYFPELTGEESRIFLKGFCEMVHMTMIEACCCLDVMNKALLERRVLLGEDREELQRILHFYRDNLITLINRATTSGIKPN